MSLNRDDLREAILSVLVCLRKIAKLSVTTLDDQIAEWANLVIGNEDLLELILDLLPGVEDPIKVESVSLTESQQAVMDRAGINLPMLLQLIMAIVQIIGPYLKKDDTDNA